MPPPTLDLPARASPSGEGGAEHEFNFSASDFEQVRKLIYERAGIHLHEGKRAMVYSRLSRRLRETGHRSFKAYLDDLRQASGAQGEQEWQEFVNCLTTNLTAFFREDHHFHALAEALRQGQFSAGRPPRIWCNAASTGEEPYSIVMVLAEVLGERSGARLVASDIDTKVLAQARRGVYSAEARGLSPERLKRFFMRGTGPNAGQIRIKPELGQMVEFRPFNLMTPSWSVGESFDMVFCRNVMIYFDHPTQRKVLERIHGVMKPQGLLFVGHSENFTDSRDLFQLRGKTIYQRV
ncbi:CheR family methyltransferase [Ideonella livida]|uniref:Chemotaxis protein methyltransferase n=1 Tax=Ideonella livida TaxID=2707176 RepID=A0A7C9TK04_9BURK|nr:CheR family methyltransferase [Ideonella livida]NDY91522.1 methyltransferase domain-containing protein [Ideonella livida]